MTGHHTAHFAKHGAEAVADLQPLRERKSPVVAFACGLLFGALGVSIYFKSIKDFVICVVLFLAASVLLPGLGSILGWFFAPAYGALRAHTSNENLGV